MNLVDIVGGKVVIHPDLYFVPAFKKLYEHDTSEDKIHQELVITYIVLMHKWSSPYKKSMDASTREIRLKEQVFNDVNYQLTEDEKIAEQEYIDWQNTRILKMLDAQMNKLDSVTKWYEESLDDCLDEKKIKDLLAGMGSTANTIKSIEALKSMVQAEELAMGKVKGDAKVNPYELAG